MSEPSYRIDFQHNPQNRFPWSAQIRRLSDDELIGVKVGETPRDAGEAAREYIVALVAPREQRQPLYLDEYGNLTAAPSAPEPQSLRA